MDQYAKIVNPGGQDVPSRMDRAGDADRQREVNDVAAADVCKSTLPYYSGQRYPFFRQDEAAEAMKRQIDAVED